MRISRQGFLGFSVLAVTGLVPLPGSAGVDTPVLASWIVTSARITGRNGEQFVSSIRIVNGTLTGPNGVVTAANVRLTFFRATALDPATGTALGDNTVNAPTAAFTVPPYQTLALDDALATVFGVTDTSGGILVESTNGVPVSVLSETLVANARSQGGTPGTTGFAIPAQVIENAVAIGDTAFVPYLSSSPTTTQGYRSNLFLLSGNPDVNSVVNVLLRRGADAYPVGPSRDITLGKLAQTQINNIASFFGSSEASTNLTAYVTVKSGGPVFLGAAVIDNAIGSQIYAPPTKRWLSSTGSFGLNLADGGYGFVGRLDVPPSGLPDFMTLPIVMDICPATPGPGTQLFFVQAFGSGPGQNATFSFQGDGSVFVTGTTKDATGAIDATFSGATRRNPDGTIYGSITYYRSSGAAGGTCPGVSKVFFFQGSLLPPNASP